MTDKTQPEAGSTHLIRYALELGLLWIDGDGRNKVREALAALDALEAKLASIGAGGAQALSAAPAEVLGWIHEDELPESYPYSAMFPHSKVDTVRVFPVFGPQAASPTPPAEQRAATKAAPGDQRKAFESWARRQSWIKDCGKAPDGDAYGHWDTQKAWLAWTAALAAPQQEAQEPAFWMNEKGHTWSHSDWKQFPKHRAKYPIPLYPHFPAPQPAPAPLSDREEIAMVDAAMVEMADIVPPLKRSECARLIRAAIAAQGGKV